MTVVEVNFDGIVGPSHNYSALAFGNLASESSHLRISNPRQSAIQGLVKMKRLMEHGVLQGVFPPRERPSLSTLRHLGFSGTDENVLVQAAKTPELLRYAYSASSMWAANAATVCPSSDASDNRVHLTPANLAFQFHRSIEGPETARILRKIFLDESLVVVHDPLPSHRNFGDEGAANHIRLAPSHSEEGTHIFGFGWSAFSHNKELPARFPARQSREASEAIARLNQLKSAAFFAQQNPVSIDGGAFHTDVVAVGNERVLLIHEDAFLKQSDLIAELSKTFEWLVVVEIPTKMVSLSDAIRSYFFNSQIVTLPSGGMLLLSPTECEEFAAVNTLRHELRDRTNGHLQFNETVDLTESMRNGGGPACLRLRVPLRKAEIESVNQNCLLTPNLYATLADWVQRHYRDRLTADDFEDPLFMRESFSSLDELTTMLGLGSIYSFQHC